MGTSSYDRIINQIISNNYIKAEIKEAHAALWTGYQVVSKSVSFSSYDKAYTVYIRAKNPMGHEISLTRQTSDKNRNAQPYLAFPWLDKDLMKDTIQPHWKKSIKTYNIPLNKFAERWHNAWDGRSIATIWPEMFEFYTACRSEVHVMLETALNDDLESTVKQAAFDFIMKKFDEMDHIVRYLDIEEVRSLADLEHIRRIHQ